MDEEAVFGTREYRRMRCMLLLTAGCIAIDQLLLSVMVLVLLLYGGYLAWRGRGEKRVRLWPPFLRYTLLLLAAAGYLSLHNPLVKDTAACTFNFLYVAGQYAAVIWLWSRFGNYFFGRERFVPPKPYVENISFRQRFRRQPFILQVLRVLGWTALFTVLLGIAQHYLGGATDTLWVDREANPLLKNRVYATWENPNIFAGYLCVAAAYLMSYISVEKDRCRRWMLFGILLLILLCVIFTFSRGFWAALGLELLIFVLFFYRKGLLYLCGVLAAGAVLAGPVIWQRLATLQNIMKDSSAAMRMAYLEIAAAIIKEHPWGIGWYNYRYVFPDYDFYFKNPDVIMYHSHNLFLNLAAELGIPGLLLFLLSWGAFIRLALRLYRKSRFSWIRAFGQGYLLMSAGILVGGLGDHVFFNVRMGILFWLLSTLVILCRQYDQYAVEDTEKAYNNKAKNTKSVNYLAL